MPETVASSPPPEVVAVRPLPTLRWGLLLAVLMAEVLCLTLFFDTGSLWRKDEWWVEWLEFSPLLLQAGIAMAAATLLFAGAPLRAKFLALARELQTTPFAWRCFCGHLLALAGFVWLSAGLLREDSRWPVDGGWWFAAWLGGGFLTVLLWAGCVLPSHRWVSAGRSAGRVGLAAVLVGYVAWRAGRLTEELWEPLSGYTFWLARGLLRLVFPEVVCDPARHLLGTPTFGIQLAPGCSGFEGIGLVLVFLGAYLWLEQENLRFPQALLLLPIGTLVIWLANALRIALLVGVGTWGSPALALGGFHSQVGWLAFNAVAIGLVLVAQRSWFFSAGTSARQGPNLAAAYLAPLLVLVAAMMVAQAIATDADALYPFRVLVVGFVLWSFRRDYECLRWTWSWPAVGIGSAVFVLWLVLEPLASGSIPAARPAALAEGPTWWAVFWLGFRVVGSVLTVPLAEELAFRGFLTRRLISADFRETPLGQFSWFSWLASSALFGALHGRWFAGVLAGMLYAVALYRRGELTDAVVAHATTNALIAAYVLATGSWSLWS